MKLLKTIILIVMMCGLAQPAVAAPHGPAAFLRKLDRQLCSRFKSLKCHRKAVPHIAPKPKAKIEKPVIPQAPVTPQPIPKPSLKPEALHLPKVPAVLPREKPKATAAVPPVAVVLPNKVPAVLPPLKTHVAAPVLIPAQPPAPAAIVPPGDAACLDLLKNKHVEFTSVSQPPGAPGCIVVQPVQMKSLLVNGVVLGLPDHPVLNCAFAVHVVQWLQDLGGAAASAKEGFALTQLYTGPGYQCRGRNGDVLGKISEHGFGNAIDVERMKFSDGQVFLVSDALDPASRSYETLKAIRASACARFTTVLGPGANEAHRAHFHFDSGVHGKSGSMRICE